MAPYVPQARPHELGRRYACVVVSVWGGGGGAFRMTTICSRFLSVGGRVCVGGGAPPGFILGLGRAGGCGYALLPATTPLRSIQLRQTERRLVTGLQLRGRLLQPLFLCFRSCFAVPNVCLRVWGCGCVCLHVRGCVCVCTCLCVCARVCVSVLTDVGDWEEAVCWAGLGWAGLGWAGLVWVEAEAQTSPPPPRATARLRDGRPPE